MRVVLSFPNKEVLPFAFQAIEMVLFDRGNMKTEDRVPNPKFTFSQRLRPRRVRNLPTVRSLFRYFLAVACFR